jgi:hypothetical protein
VLKSSGVMPSRPRREFIQKHALKVKDIDYRGA